MGLRIFMAGAMLASLGGCGEGSENKAANDSTPAKKAVAATGGKMDCSKLPDFVPLLAVTRIESCVLGPKEEGTESGTVIYVTATKPEAVLAWYKAKAIAAGMTKTMASPTVYGARETGKRGLMVLTDVMNDGTWVTVNWDRAL